MRCCAPGCKSGRAVSSEIVAFHRFPTNPIRQKEWTSKVPWENWVPVKGARLCEKHFTRDMYRTDRVDKKNPWRAEKKSVLSKKLLKSDAVPSIWPNCPDHLTKHPSNPRCSKNSSGVRTRIEENKVVWLTSLSDFDNSYDTQKVPLSVSLYRRKPTKFFCS